MGRFDILHGFAVILPAASLKWYYPKRATPPMMIHLTKILFHPKIPYVCFYNDVESP